MIKAIEIEGNFTIINEEGKVTEHLEDGVATLITDGNLLVLKKGKRIATIEPMREDTKERIEEAWNKAKEAWDKLSASKIWDEFKKNPEKEGLKEKLLEYIKSL